MYLHYTVLLIAKCAIDALNITQYSNDIVRTVRKYFHPVCIALQHKPAPVPCSVAGEY